MSNTMLVTIDSLRRDYLQYMPNTVDFFDTSYDNAYATYPSTIGSFQSILGGIYPDTVGVEKTGTFVSSLESDNAFGITTNILASDKYGYDDGFTDFDALAESGLNRDIGRMLPEGTVYKIASTVWGIFLKISYKFKEPDREFPRASTVIETLQNHLESLNSDAKVFTWLHFMDTHHPFHAETYGELSRSDAYQVTKTVMGQNGGTESEEKLTEELYKNTVKQLDDDLQELWELVDDDCDIIFCADHGEHLGEDNHWGHHEYLDEHLLNVPFLTKNMSIPESQVISLIDIPSIILKQDWKQGQNGNREYAYAMCDDKRAVTNGDQILTTDDNFEEAPSELVRKLQRFDPERVVNQNEALQEDLEALGYA